MTARHDILGRGEPRTDPPDASIDSQVRMGRTAEPDGLCPKGRTAARVMAIRWTSPRGGAKMGSSSGFPACEADMATDGPLASGSEAATGVTELSTMITDVPKTPDSLSTDPEQFCRTTLERLEQELWLRVRDQLGMRPRPLRLTLDPADSIGAVAGVAYVSQMLTVRRTLYIELDSMAAPVLPGDGPFDGTGVGNDDVNPGNMGNVNIGLVAPELARAYVDVATVPLEQDVQDEEAFEHNTVITLARLQTTVRDVISTETLWVVQVMAAYEAEPAEDWDGERAWTAGVTMIRPDTAAFIFMETIRDMASMPAAPPAPAIPAPGEGLPGVVAFGVLEQRTVLHEILHHFDMSHLVVPRPCYDFGIMDSTTVSTGPAVDNQLNTCQIDKIRDELEP